MPVARRLGRSIARPPQLAGLALAGLALATCAPPRTAALAVRHQGSWIQWWRADRAPERWKEADPRVTRALSWRALGEGVQWATLDLAGAGPSWRTELIVVRVDPRRVRLSLEMGLSPEDGRPAWSLDRAPPEALVALNAGQFLLTMPWGWLVMDGIQRLEPGVGPLSTAVALDDSGAVRWIAGDSLATPPVGIVNAFQSYPTLLAHDGTIPGALRGQGRGMDLAHRDARLAIGGTRDGELLLVMTRFAALGPAARTIPVGPTTPEMAAILGALGASDAVMLDGGISAQMLLRDPASGLRWRWPGWRRVPLALIVSPRGG